GPVAVIAVEPATLLRETGGAAEDGDAVVVAVGVLATRRRLAGIEDGVVGDEEVEVPVAVVVEPGAARGVVAAGTEQAGLFGDIGECAVAVVVEEEIARPTGDEEVVEAVVVVIGDGDSGGPDAAAQASFRGDIGKC